MSLLEDIREKPAHTKNVIAFGVALLVTGVVTGIWLLSLPTQLSSENTGSAGSEVDQEKSRDGISDFFSGATEQFGTVIDSFENLNKDKQVVDDVQQITFSEVEEEGMVKDVAEELTNIEIVENQKNEVVQEETDQAIAEITTIKELPEEQEIEEYTEPQIVLIGTSSSQTDE